MLDLQGMQSTPSLPSFPSPIWLGVVAPDRVLSMGQIQLFEIQTMCKQMTNAKLNQLKHKFDYFSVCKQMTDV